MPKKRFANARGPTPPREEARRPHARWLCVPLIASMFCLAVPTAGLRGQAIRPAATPIKLTAIGSAFPGAHLADRLQAGEGRSHRVAGAAIGFVVGAGATYFALNSGGSTSKCDRDANQDALSSGECLGLYALGGLAGAGLGAIVGGFIRTGRSDDRRLDAVGFGVTRERAVVLALRMRR